MCAPCEFHNTMASPLPKSWGIREWALTGLLIAIVSYHWSHILKALEG
jgi:hypothetical protein